MTAIVSPVAIEPPSDTPSSSTVPPTGAVISFSIFIASITHTRAPSSTFAPFFTATLSTVPCSGDTSSPAAPPPEAPARSLRLGALRAGPPAGAAPAGAPCPPAPLGALGARPPRGGGAVGGPRRADHLDVEAAARHLHGVVALDLLLFVLVSGRIGRREGQLLEPLLVLHQVAA